MTPLFIPNHYRAADPAALIHRQPFAQLITGGGEDVQATWTPLVFERDGDETRLVGHVARRNPQAASLYDGMPFLAIFTGPHAYVSSRFYREKPQVPTWNYVATQVRGHLTPIDDEAGQLAVLRRTIEIMERDQREPWTMEQAPDGRVATLMPMIRSFRMHVTSMEGAEKLSQSHPPGDRQRVIFELLRQGDGVSAELARLMATLV